MGDQNIRLKSKGLTLAWRKYSSCLIYWYTAEYMAQRFHSEVWHINMMLRLKYSRVGIETAQHLACWWEARVPLPGPESILQNMLKIQSATEPFTQVPQWARKSMCRIVDETEPQSPGPKAWVGAKVSQVLHQVPQFYSFLCLMKIYFCCSSLPTVIINWQ